MKRVKWTQSNSRELYISYFDVFNHNSSMEYLEMIHEAKLYEDLYYEIYIERTTETSYWRTINKHVTLK